MFSDYNVLNRSHSESDLYISQFDNLTVGSSGKNFIKSFHNSCSSIVRRVYIEEIICPEGKQIGNMFSKCAIDEPKYIRSIKPQETYKMHYENDIDEMPMEVDDSYQEERFPEISTNQINVMPRLRNVSVFNDEELDCDNVQNKLLPEETIKPRVIHINPVKKKNNWSKLIVLFLAICILCFLSFANIFNSFIVNNDIHLENIKNDLELNMHGHTHLVAKLVNILDQRVNWANKLQVIGFIGSQGVGKTFLAGLLKAHFPNHLSHDIYGTHLFYPHQKQKVIDAIDDCCLNLIVIDDLKLADTVELFAFAHSLPKNAFILLIPIFNIHYTDNTLNTIVNHGDIIKIRDSFVDSGINNYELFVFKDFTYEQIKDWIKKILDKKNISLLTKEKILENIVSTHDIKHGLKGLHSKIILEVEKHGS